MAYQNINFPTLRLKHDFLEENIAPVTVISNFSAEYRISRYSSPKRRFTFPARNILASDWATLSTFMTTVGYQRDSFDFTHPFSGTVIKVRFDSIPDARTVTIGANGAPTIIAISDINLIEVFNE